MDPTNLLQLESYDYLLPAERIAQHPVTPRDSSRLLVVSRKSNSLTDAVFRNLPDFLQPKDLIVVNDTRVLPARLQSSHGEVLLIRETDPFVWDAMVNPGKHFKPGTRVEFPDGLRAEVLSYSTAGRLLRFESTVVPLLKKYGKMPLPPYIEREAVKQDEKSYQTVYARKTGSVAAPTAGLHFTRRLLKALKEKGIGIAKLTLHVGPGTFRPVKNQDITLHRIMPEYYFCSNKEWEKIRLAGRVIAVGTTTTRALETIAITGELEGYTGLFIYPGYRFRILQGLITNFHLPRSSLLMLVSAFGEYSRIRRAYRHAIENHYRFYSYGDAMLIL